MRITFRNKNRKRAFLAIIAVLFSFALNAQIEMNTKVRSWGMMTDGNYGMCLRVALTNTDSVAVCNPQIDMDITNFPTLIGLDIQNLFGAGFDISDIDTSPSGFSASNTTGNVIDPATTKCIGANQTLFFNFKVYADPSVWGDATTYIWSATSQAVHPIDGLQSISNSIPTESMYDSDIILGGALQFYDNGTPMSFDGPVTPNLDGTYDLTFRATVGNYDNLANTGGSASSIRYEDDMAIIYNNMPINTVSVSNTGGGSFTVNNAYNAGASLLGGTAVTPDDVLISNGSLAVGAEDFVEVTMNVGPIDISRQRDKSFTSGRIFGVDGSGNTIETETNRGLDPSGGSVQGPAVSCDNGFQFRFDYTANFNLSLDVINEAPAASGTSGNLDLTYEVTVSADAANDVNIYRLSAINDLATSFGADFVGIVTAPTVINTDATSPPLANSGFDGATGSGYGSGVDLLNGNNTNLLEPGQSFRIRYTVEVQNTGAPLTYTNEVNAIGDNSLNGLIVSASITDAFTSTANPRISISDAASDEGSNMTFTINSTVALPTDIIFDLSYTDVTTVAADYSGPLQVTLPANTSSVDFQVSALDDNWLEPTQTFEVTLANTLGIVSFTDATGIGTITDTDISNLNSGNLDVDENIGTGFLPIRISTGTNGSGIPYAGIESPVELEIIFFEEPSAVAFRASPVQDFTAYTALATIPANSVPGTEILVPFTIVDDAVTEPSEFFIRDYNVINPVNYSGRLSISDSGRGPIRIHDNDSATITLQDITVNENVGTTSYSLTLAGNVQDAFDISYATSDASAVAPGDYTIASNTLSFSGTDGEIRSATLTIIDDALLEVDEDFTVTGTYSALPPGFANGQPQDITFTNNTGSVTIIDNDADNDGDGIADITDLDDDNDGILDIEECSFVVNSGSSNSSSFAGSGQNGISSEVTINLSSFCGPSYSSGDIIHHNFVINDDSFNNNTIIVYVEEIIGGVATIVDSMFLEDFIANNEYLYTVSSTLVESLRIRMEGTPAGTSSDTYDIDITYGCGVCSDTDGDLIPNYLDLDSDNDGIPDNIEAQTTTGYIAPNGVVGANGLDTAYPSGLIPTNTDGTDTPDYLDTDSDNEGGNDTVEAQITLLNLDADNDGLDDATDATADYSDVGGTIDNPLTAPVVLPDMDNDATTGGDVDFRDSADDSPDNDNDGIPDLADLDDDNDGITDAMEASECIDNDRMAWNFNVPAGNYSLDYFENPAITDWLVTSTGDITVGAGLTAATPGTELEISGLDAPTYQTAILNDDYVEATFTTGTGLIDPKMHSIGMNWYRNSVAPAQIGNSYDIALFISDNNFTTSTLVSADLRISYPTDGISEFFTLTAADFELDLNENTTYTLRVYVYNQQNDGNVAHSVFDDFTARFSACEAIDTDSDGIFNHIDLDSDNDGILDAVEAGHASPHTNGILNGTVGTDGIPNAVQADPDGGVVNYTLAESAEDTDTIFNFLDLDSDGDGLPDNVEVQTTIGYIAPSGTVDANGIDTAYPIGIVPTNTDGVDNPDYLDLDSDNEGGNDTAEANITLTGNDADGDGLDDATDATADYSDVGGTIDNPLNAPVILPDSDSDATTGGDVDFRDDTDDRLDSDNDGIPDVVDLDDDNDGILDFDENPDKLQGIFGWWFNSPQGTVAMDYVDDDFTDTDYTGNGTRITDWVLATADDISIQGISAITTNGNIAIGTMGSPDLNSAMANGDYVEFNFTMGAEVSQAELVAIRSGWLTPSRGDSFYSSMYYSEASGAMQPLSQDVFHTNDGSAYAQFDLSDLNSVPLSAGTSYTFRLYLYGQVDDTTDNFSTLDDFRFFVKASRETDADNDGIVNRLDLDADNDGIYDAVESGHGQTHTDGVVDGLTGIDGIPDAVQNVVDDSNVNYMVSDSDADFIVDHLELDADSDTCFDAIEAGYTDGDGDGLLGDSPVTVDANGVVTSGSDGYTVPQDLDTNTIFDFQEAGVVPTISTQPIDVVGCDNGSASFTLAGNDIDTYQWQQFDGTTWTDLTDFGVYSGSTTATLTLTLNDVTLVDTGSRFRAILSSSNYACGDVTSDEAVLTIAATPNVTIGDASATEGDAVSFPITLDSPSCLNEDIILTFNFTDGTADGTDYTNANIQITIPGGQTTADLVVATTQDDTDEPDETFTVSIASVDSGTLGATTDTALGTILDDDEAIDIDSDDDGILDSFEDLNADGDNDPATDPSDADGDLIPDYLDIDSDDDGIPDNVEAQTTAGYVPPSLVDVNGNGLDDAYENEIAIGLVPVNTDGTDMPDYLDPDSDNDNVPDSTEGHDQDQDGLPDVILVGSDQDSDGLDDAFEGSELIDIDVNDEIDDPANDLPDTDNDGESDYRDTDDDNDGILTMDEDNDMDGNYGNDDFDNDGIPDYLDPDLVMEVEDVEVFNVVTPNGDNVHDFLTITGLERRTNNNLQIYNRWGVLVYSTESYNTSGNVFDGTSQARVTVGEDERLPEGTYFYLFNYEDTDGTTVNLSGYLYLN